MNTEEQATKFEIMVLKPILKKFPEQGYDYLIQLVDGSAYYLLELQNIQFQKIMVNQANKYFNQNKNR